MKKQLIFILMFLFLFTSTVFGQTLSITQKISPTKSAADNNAVENLKEKIANKVEELRKKNNRAVAGKVLSISSSLIKIRTFKDEDFDIKLDDTLTKYYSILGSQQKEITSDDISKDDYIIVTGVITDKTVAANSIFIDQQYFIGSGKISQVDKDNYILKVITSDKAVYNLSIETFTKQQMVNIKTLDMERVGFSKIKEGDSVHFSIKVVGNEKNNEYQADKILIVPQEYFIK